MPKYDFEVWQRLPSHPYPRRIEYASFDADSFTDALDFASRYAIIEHGWNSCLWIVDRSTGWPHEINLEEYQRCVEEEPGFARLVADEGDN